MKNHTKNLKIERIFDRDIPFVKKIEEECFAGKFHENFDALISNDNYVYLLARLGEKIVGYGAISIQYEQSDLLYVAVLNEFRRKKIATTLLNNLISIAKTRGAKEVFLEVEVDNESAISLYRKLGFDFLNERKNYYGNKSALVFVKKL